MNNLTDIEIDILIRKKEALQDEVCKLQVEKEKYRNIEATLDEFWDILLELQIAKRKEAPTLEEFAEALEKIKAEAITEFWERLKQKKTIRVTTNFGLRFSKEEIEVKYGDNLVKEMTEKES